MKSVIFAAAFAVSAAGAASAQTAACGQMTQLMASTQAKVKTLHGPQVEAGEDAITFTSKIQLAGFKACTVEAGKAADKFTGYWEEHLSCSGEADSADAANQFVESLWSCTRDIYTERHAVEAWIDGGYRVIGFEGEAPTAGRSAGLVDFGGANYARVVVEKAFDTSEEYRLNLYWSFK